MREGSAGKIRKSWRNESTEVVLREYSSPTRYELEVSPIKKSGPFILTRTYPTKNLALAEELYSTAIEKPGEDPVLLAVISVWEAEKKDPRVRGRSEREGDDNSVLS